MLATVLPRSIASAELDAAKRVPYRPEQLVAWRGVVAIDQERDGNAEALPGARCEAPLAAQDVASVAGLGEHGGRAGDAGAVAASRHEWLDTTADAAWMVGVDAGDADDGALTRLVVPRAKPRFAPAICTCVACVGI